MTDPTVPGAVLAARALEICREFAGAGIRETTGPDRSPEIDRIESLWGLEASAYCAMGAIFCYLKALAFLTGRPTDLTTLHTLLKTELPAYFLPDPQCHVMAEDAVRRNIWETNVVQCRPGDLVFFNWQGEKSPARVQHVGLFAGTDAGSDFHTMEWNTSPPADALAASAGRPAVNGCYGKLRSPSVTAGAIRVSAR
jgi:hypothetical protein